MAAKILVPIDFSEMTPQVVHWATSLARDRNATLILLHAQEPVPESFAGEMCFPLPLAENPMVRQALLEIVPDDKSVACEHRLLMGPAPEMILDAANEGHVELIVMGSHGRGWLGRLLMGSVAEHVMRHAPCPVLIVRPANPKSACETMPDHAAGAKSQPQ